MQLDGVVPVLDAGQGVDVDLSDGPAELDRVAKGVVQLGGDGGAARVVEQAAGDRLGGEEGADLEELERGGIALFELAQRTSQAAATDMG